MPFTRGRFSGFPFDREERDRDRDGNLRTQLDDIAKRHPEIAEHLQSFPLRGNRRQHSADDPEFFRRFERPFGARLDRFGFPFEREEFVDPRQHPEFQQAQPQQQQQEYYQPQAGYYQPQQEAQPEEEKVAEKQGEGCTCTHCECCGHSKKPEPDRGRARNIQQSNTVDLGQKQEPINDREPRSMSAPPDNRQRFMSSINIPIQRENEDGAAKHYTSHPQQQQQGPQTTMTGERVIPIHVEGRDVPIVPKNVHNFGTPPPQPQPEKVFGGGQPQPERIFGQRPEQFTQFVREPRQFGGTDWHHPGFAPHPEEFVRKQNAPQHSAAPQRAKSPQPAPAPPQRAKSPQPQAQQAQAPPQQQQAPPKPQPPTPIEQIQTIQKDVSGLMKQVDEFTGVPKDKQYMYLDEMFTRNLLKLDNIETGGHEGIRNARKEAIKCINDCIGVLEAKAAANAKGPEDEAVKKEEEEKAEPMEADAQTNDNQCEKQEELASEAGGEAKKDEGSAEEVKPEAENAAEESTASVSEMVAKIEEEKEEDSKPEEGKKEKKKTKKKGEKKQ